MAVKFNLYSSEGCHLCEMAHELITQVLAKADFAVIDIVDDKIPNTDLVALYGVHIPVFERLSDNEKLFWPFDSRQIIEFIK